MANNYYYYTTSFKTDGSNFVNLSSSDTVFVASGITIGCPTSATVLAGASGNTFWISGTLYSALGNAIAVTDNAHLSLTSTGAIVGWFGFVATGSGGQNFIDNAGQIMCSQNAIALSGSGNTVNNTGSIGSSYYHAISSAGDALQITNSGSIHAADDEAIALTGSGQSIVNSGIISADRGHAVESDGSLTLSNAGSILASAGYDAIFSSGESDSVVNTGTMIGMVHLGGSDDVFDSHLGRISGAIFGQAGNDQLIGSDSGNDVLVGGSGADELIGGGGTMDVASYVDASVGLTADLQLAYKNTGDAAGDSYSGIEGLRGSSHDDILYGDNGANRIVGGDGFDQIFGRDGNDVLQGGNTSDHLDGGAGNDRIDGGDGFDFASYEDATTGVSVSLAITGAQNTVGAGVDTLISIGGLIGSNYADKLTGSAGNDNLLGGAGNDVLYGGDSGSGSDVIDGGLGADQLYGQGGRDIFAFSTALSNASFDTIHDFTVSDDAISLDDSIFTTLPTGNLNPNAFFIGAAAHDADDRIIYNDQTGALFYDADGTGSGAAVEFALVAKHLAMTSANFGVSGEIII